MPLSGTIIAIKEYRNEHSSNISFVRNLKGGKGVNLMRKEMSQTQEIKTGVQTILRLCLHTESGGSRIAKSCIHKYQCGNCAFDQWLDEMEARENVWRIAG